MEHTKAARLLRIAAAGCAILLAVMRFVILKTAFDEAGLLPAGSKVLALTVLASACCFALLCLLALRLNRLPGTEACFARSPLFLCLRLAAAVLVFFGALTTLLGGAGEAAATERLASLSGIAAALAMVWSTLTADRGKLLFWPRLVTALYVGTALILRFRSWSYDPLIIRFAPLLLAWTCFMVETMLLSGYPLGAGHRRSGALFGFAAGVFACMALPDYIFGLRTELSELLMLLGLGLWCVEAGFSLTRREVQEEAPKPEAEKE